MAQTRAWRINIGSGLEAFVGGKAMVEFVLANDVSLIPVPKVPHFAPGVMVWRNQIIPVLDLAMAAQPQLDHEPMTGVMILAYQAAPGQPLQYGGLALRKSPQGVTVTSDMGAQAPIDTAPWTPVSLGWLNTGDAVLPILNMSQIFLGAAQKMMQQTVVAAVTDVEARSKADVEREASSPQQVEQQVTDIVADNNYELQATPDSPDGLAEVVTDDRIRQNVEVSGLILPGMNDSAAVIHSQSAPASDDDLALHLNAHAEGMDDAMQEYTSDMEMPSDDLADQLNAHADDMNLQVDDDAAKINEPQDDIKTQLQSNLAALDAAVDKVEQSSEQHWVDQTQEIIIDPVPDSEDGLGDITIDIESAEEEQGAIDLSPDFSSSGIFGFDAGHVVNDKESLADNGLVLPLTDYEREEAINHADAAANDLAMQNEIESSEADMDALAANEFSAGTGMQPEQSSDAKQKKSFFGKGSAAWKVWQK